MQWYADPMVVIVVGFAGGGVDGTDGDGEEGEDGAGDDGDGEDGGGRVTHAGGRLLDGLAVVAVAATVVMPWPTIAADATNTAATANVFLLLMPLTFAVVPLPGRERNR